MSVEPVSLAISNPGFEADLVSEGCFEGLLPTGWPVYDPNGILDGVWNAVGGLNLPPGSVWFPGGAPEGDHVALVFLSTAIGAGPAGLTQVLGDTLQADTTYTLSVQVGNIASGIGPPPCDVFGFFDLNGFPGYQVQLLASGVVIAEDDNSLAGTIPEGEFRLSTIQVTVGITHPQLGDTLEIRLINLNVADTPGDPGIEVDFDDVRLVAQPACAALDGDFDTDCDVDLDDHRDIRGVPERARRKHSATRMYAGAIRPRRPPRRPGCRLTRFQVVSRRGHRKLTNPMNTVSMHYSAAQTVHYRLYPLTQ